MAGVALRALSGGAGQAAPTVADARSAVSGGTGGIGAVTIGGGRASEVPPWVWALAGVALAYWLTRRRS